MCVIVVWVMCLSYFFSVMLVESSNGCNLMCACHLLVVCAVHAVVVRPLSTRIGTRGVRHGPMRSRANAYLIQSTCSTGATRAASGWYSYVAVICSDIAAALWAACVVLPFNESCKRKIYK